MIGLHFEKPFGLNIKEAQKIKKVLKVKIIPQLCCLQQKKL